jgi:hypothetical protein
VKLAFDLDDTLIPARFSFPVQTNPAGFLRRWLCSEPLRLGTVQLFHDLRERGHSIGIYTTSFRSVLATRLMFWANGAPVEWVINQAMHLRRTKACGKAQATYGGKAPSLFDIDVLVDDCDGLLPDEKPRKFHVIRVSPEDLRWTDTVLTVIDQLHEGRPAFKCFGASDCRRNPK